MRLLEEIWAITQKECAEVELSDDVAGDIAASIDDLNLKQLATYYRKKQQEFKKLQEAVDAVDEEYPPAHLVVEINAAIADIDIVWSLISYSVDCKYGHLLSPQEREDGISWEIRQGWLLWKSPPEDTTPRSRKVTSAKKRAMMI